VWRHWLPLLRRRCNVILLDLPGFGRSPAQAALTVDALLDQLLEYVPRNSALLGWSLGGNIALAFSARFPDHCRALMTIACNPCFVAHSDWLPGMAPEIFQQFQSELREDADATQRRFLGLQAKGSDGERQLLRWLRALPASSISPSTLSWGLDLLAALDVRAALQESTLPAVHIYGSADLLVPVTVGRAVTVLAPEHWVVEMDRAAHLAFVSHGELCWQHLDRLLANAKLLKRPRALQREKKSVAASFSRAAPTYDTAAALQRAVADNLLALVDAPAGGAALDIGCGTGTVSAALAKKYSVVALDLAEGMLRFARTNVVGDNLQWLCGDAENLPLADNSIDAVFSSLAVQWCENIGAVFAELQRVLRPGGSAWISTLGPNTLHELRAAWSSVDEQVHVNTFAASETLIAAVQRSGLTLWLWREDNVVMRYAELRQLTRELKALGAHNVNNGRPGGLLSRQRLQAFSAAYEAQRADDNLLPATYQVYYLHLTKAPAMQ
ncbi:MAG TPA: malonyl-ACP O-methyltransferase BioC, partial [Spongiibacteraceae bacterium]|nr:malonyl-ACP O-methyltransferase BioC [Spongiibacteraceae bacterium]